MKNFILTKPQLFSAATQGVVQLSVYGWARNEGKDPTPYLIVAGLLGLAFSEVVIETAKNSSKKYLQPRRG